MGSAAKIMEKPREEQPQTAAALSLRCPRCDSSNTKFCYYNNYSLSQPRHFCKACKRYWTRGGTLRNVPVGGGCRKNKRLKTSTSSSVNGGASSTSPANQNPRPQNGNHINPILYGVHNTNPSDLNLQFSSVETVSGLNFPPQFDGITLGFSSGFLSHIADMQAGCNSTKQIQHTNQFHHPTISIDRNMQLVGNSGAHWIPMKEEKTESMNRLCQNQTDQIDLSFSDPSHYWNPTTATGNWHDPTNITGSSVSSLF